VLSPPTALIADDLKMFLLVAKTFLEGRGIGVLTAENGAKALELARARRPRLILLDLMMPVMDGADACAEMRRDPGLAFTPIIIMSASGVQEDRERCLLAGCTNFVIKPQKPSELLAIIAKILSVRQRKPVRMPVVFNESGPGSHLQQIGRAGNLSGTGMLLLAGKPVRAGSILDLEFVIPDSNHPVKVQGKVARVDQDTEGTYGAGIHFLGLSDVDQQRVVAYVSA
jgi:CheY-like chemotaxis protein